MRDWLNNIAGPQYASAIVWTVGALVLLVVLLVLIRMVRNISSGTFVAGGRNRKTRLAVMDATAVDSQRRLVLVRRDDVEHLILIGGPTDVVVEQNILPGGGASRASRGLADPDLTPVGPERSTPQPAAPAERPRAVAPAPNRQRTEPVAPLPTVTRPSDASADDIHRLEPRELAASEMPSPRRDSEPVVATSASSGAAPQAAHQPAAISAPVVGLGSVHFLETTRITPTPSAPSAAFPVAEPAIPEIAVRDEPATPPPAREYAGTNMDAALQRELSSPLDKQPNNSADPDPSLEDEMKRLLGELSAPSRN